MARWIVVLVLAAGALGVWLLWSTERSTRGQGSVPEGNSPSGPPSAALRASSLASAREELSAAVAPRSATIEGAAEDSEKDPPTPAAPGPGQALLRVRAVALEGGAALGGIELDLLAANENDEEHEWQSSTQADPARGVENDVLRTRADGTADFLVEAGFGYMLRGHGANGRADWATLELGSFRAGEERAVTLALPTAWTLTWRARAVDAASGAALAGVEVRAFASDGGDENDPVPVLARAISGADGRVKLRLPAWESLTADFRLPGYAIDSCLVRRTEQGPAEPQELPLRRAAALTFTVLDDAQRPALGVEIRVLGVGFRGEFGASWSQVTDASGQATLRGLPSAVPLRASAWRNGHSLGRAAALENDLVLEPGEQRGIEVRLPGTGRVEGRLLDVRGDALVGVPVRAVGMYAGMERSPLLAHLQATLAPLESLGASATVGLEATTNSDGRFTFAGLPIGIYHVGVAPGGDVPALGKLLVVRGEETSAIELVLERALWIRGRVLDPRGAPAPDVGLVCIGQGSVNALTRASATTEGNGSFALGPLLPGRYEVRVGGVEDEHSAPFEPLVVEAGTEGLALALVLGGTLAIELENGLDDERLDVRVRREGAAETSGRLYSLAPGRYEVLAVSDDGRFAFERGVVITGGRDHTLTLTLAPGATVTLPEDPGAIDSFQVSVDGFALGTLWPHREHTVPPGHVRVEGQAWSARARLETVLVRERDLAPGEAWTVDLAH